MVPDHEQWAQWMGVSADRAGAAPGGVTRAGRPVLSREKKVMLAL